MTEKKWNPELWKPISIKPVEVKEVVQPGKLNSFLDYQAPVICPDIPKLRLQSYPYGPQIPEKYRKKFIHPENGFVKLFCEEYDKSDNDE